MSKNLIESNTTFGQKARAFMSMVALQRQVIKLNSDIDKLKKGHAAERKEWREQMQVMGQMVQELAKGDLDIDNIDLTAFLDG